jgi:hypothetical protein
MRKKISQEFKSINGQNLEALKKAAQSCGEPTEWKERLLRDWSVILFQAGADQGETVEVRWIFITVTSYSLMNSTIDYFTMCNSTVSLAFHFLQLT